MSKLVKMIANECWSSKRNAQPLINAMPHQTKMITTEKEMVRGLKRTAPTYTQNVVWRNDAPTEKVVFSWNAVAKKPPSEHRDLKWNLFLPHVVEHTPFRRNTCCREINICPLNRITINRVKNPPPPVKNMVLQNNIMQHRCTLDNCLLLPHQKTPLLHPGTATNNPPPTLHLLHRHPFIYR